LVFAPVGADHDPVVHGIPRGCLQCILTGADHVPLGHDAVKYPCKYGYFSKRPLGTLLVGIKSKKYKGDIEAYREETTYLV